jgi:nucleoid DNA-binding protein
MAGKSDIVEFIADNVEGISKKLASKNVRFKAGKDLKSTVNG